MLVTIMALDKLSRRTFGKAVGAIVPGTLASSVTARAGNATAKVL